MKVGCRTYQGVVASAYILQKTGSNKEFSRIFSFRRKGVNPIDVTFQSFDDFDQVQKF